MGVEKTGLQAILETKEFQQGLKIYLDGLKAATEATEKSSKSMTRAGSTWDDNAKRWRDSSGKFVAGAAPVINSTKGMQKQLTGLGGMLTGVITGLGATGGAMGGVATAGTGLGGVLGGVLGPALVAVGAAAIAAFVIIKEVIAVIREAVVAAKELIVESTVLASRWNELARVAQLMGQRFGMTADEVDNLIEQMTEAGIRADVAAQAVTQFVRMEMDPALALELGKAAQNFAILAEGGKDSSETLESLMVGIQRLSPLMLRNAGATIHLQGAYADMAAELGVAQDSLTTVQKQQAAYNAVLAQGARISGAYEVAMETAGKQMRSLTGREIPTLKNALGAPFQEAFLNVASSLREVVKAITDAISEGGALYPVMINLGAIAAIITDSFRYAAAAFTSWVGALKIAMDVPREVSGAIRGGTQDVKEASSEMMEAAGEGIKEGSEKPELAVTNMILNVTDIIATAVDEAVMWGANLVTGLAEGIIQAASTVLVQAIHYVGSILTFWMKGQSPPRMAPEILEWGKAAMTTFLEGFAQADFTALKALQSPIKSALDLLVSAGELTATESAQAFLNLSEQIAEALSSGTADQSLFDKIAQEAGEFGNEIAELAEGQFALAAATTAVAEAQERVNEAFEKEQTAEASVRSLTDEYNRLLRAGASDAILKAKLAEINAQEEQALIAREEREAAEEELSNKEETLAILKEQVSLQKQLVDQLLALAKAAIIPGEADTGVGDGGVGVDEDLPGGIGGIPIDPESIRDKIKEAVNIAKEELLRRWGETWDAVKKLFQEKIAAALLPIQIAWAEFVKNWQGEFDSKLGPLWEAIVEWVEVTLPEAWATFTEAMWVAWDMISVYLIPIFEELNEIMTLMWGILFASLLPAWNLYSQALTIVYLYVKRFLLKILEKLNIELDLGAAATFWYQVAVLALRTALFFVLDQLRRFKDLLKSIRDLILNMPAWSDVTKNSPVPLAEGLKEVNAQLFLMSKRALPDVSQQINRLNGMQFGHTLSPTMQQSVIAPSSNRVMNLNQQNNIQSPMDLVTFRAMFNQVVREQFAGV